MFVTLVALLLLLLCVTVAIWFISRLVNSAEVVVATLEGGFFVLTLLWILEELKL